MLNIAMLSHWHEHGNRYVEELKKIDAAKIVRVWDDDERRGSDWAASLGVPFEASLERIMTDTDIGGVCVTSATSLHRDIILKACEAKKHVFCEKTLALSVEDALEIKTAVERSGIVFTMAFPRRSNPEFAYAKTLYESDELGEPSLLRIRVGLPKSIADGLPDYWFRRAGTGGGVLMDLGCHPVYLAFGLFGEPLSVSAMLTYKRRTENEDGAVCNLMFKNKAIAAIEITNNAVVPSVYSFELFGTKAAYIVNGTSGTAMLKHGDGQAVLLPYSGLPAGPVTPMEQWVKACHDGGKTDFGVDEGVMLTRILCAAYRSHAEERTIYL